MNSSESTLEPIDSLSILPESIFYKILSLLDIKELLRMSKVSRQCRILCLSSPFLNVDKTFSDDTEFYSFAECLDRYISLHTGAAIRKFCLRVNCWSLEHDIGFRIGTWLLYMARHNIESVHLDLDLGIIDEFILPIGFLNCASLTSLKLELENCCLEIPTKACSSLQNLKLKFFRMLMLDNFGEWITDTCRSLKKLHLIGFCGVCKLNIDSLSLEELVIMNKEDAEELTCIKVSGERLEYLSVAWLIKNLESKSLEIYAPKLKEFLWTGDPCNYYCQGSFDNLENATIYVGCSPKEERVDVNLLVNNLLQTICHVSSLEVSDLFTVMLGNNLPLSLERLQTLTLMIGGRNILIPDIASFFGSLNLLKILKVHFDSSSSDGPFLKNNFDSMYWEAQTLKLVDSLEEVEVTLEEGKEYEIELVKYLLERAKALKKMTILYDCKLLQQPFFISRKLQHFKKAASSAEVYFIPH